MTQEFDAIAHEYDAAFSHTALGRLLRERVWDVLGDSVICEFGDLESTYSNHQIHKSPNPQILELNCGTGEDAIWLAKQGWQVLATDASAEMVAVAKAKIQHAGLAEKVEVRICGFSELEQLPEGDFDLIFSNFGGLNCVSPEALERLGEDIASKLKPGGKFIAVVMGRFCWWETLYFLLKGKPRAAFRRFSKKPVDARLDAKTTVPTWYYSPSEFKDLISVARGQKADRSTAGKVKSQRPKVKSQTHRFLAAAVLPESFF